jgi:hypothetical protein
MKHKNFQKKVIMIGLILGSFAFVFSILNINIIDTSYARSDNSYLAGILSLTPQSSSNYRTSSIDGPGLRSPDTTAYHGISSEKNLDQLIVFLTNFFLSFATTVAILALIYGGYLWIIDGGEGSMAEKARKVLAGAVIGLLIIITAYTLINTVTRYFSHQDQCEIAIRTGNQGNIGLYCQGSILDDDGNQVTSFGIGGFLGDLIGGWISW